MSISLQNVRFDTGRTDLPLSSLNASPPALMALPALVRKNCIALRMLVLFAWHMVHKSIHASALVGYFWSVNLRMKFALVETLPSYSFGQSTSVLLSLLARSSLWKMRRSETLSNLPSVGVVCPYVSVCLLQSKAHGMCNGERLPPSVSLHLFFGVSVSACVCMHA